MAARPNGQGSKWIRRAKRLAIYERDWFRCVYCGEADASKLTLDHLVASEAGGLR